jgi:ATP-dependent DNA helicase 2 subunit 1
MDGVYTLFSASPPSAARIRQLQAMVDDIGIFHATIGSQKKGPYCPLNEAFWACSQAFNAKAQASAFDFRRIWLFTNDDNPNGHSASEQARIIQAARDCAESGIEVSLWHMNRTDAHSGRSVDFDPQKFYTKLLVAEGDEEEADSIDYRMKGAGYDGFDAMMASVRRKEHKKRSMGSLIFHLGDPATAKGVGVKLFKLVNPMKKPTHTWLYSRTNEPLKVLR